jgi:hypothetical protein
MNRSRMMFLNLIFVMFLSVTTGVCSAQEEGNTRIFNNSYSSVWKATLQSIVEGGDSIQSKDKESGTISTEWFVLKESAIWTPGWKVKENILIEEVSKNETKVTLNLLFQKKYGKGAWKPESNDNDYTQPIEKAFFEGISKRLGK